VIASKSKTSKKSSSAPNKAKEENTKENVKENSSLRSRLKSDSLDMMDLEKLNEENLKTRSFRGRRNRFVIILLSVLLAVAIAAVAIIFARSKIDYNCHLKINGNVSANYIVDGREMNEFRVPATIQGNRVLMLDTKINIESSGEYMVQFVVEVYQGSLLLAGVQLTGVDHYNFELSQDGKTFKSRAPISGNQTIALFNGIAIDNDYEATLNDGNFRLEVITSFTRV